MRPRLLSEIKSDLTLGWARTQGADPACRECLPVPHEASCMLNRRIKIGLSGAVSGALSFPRRHWPSRPLCPCICKDSVDTTACFRVLEVFTEEEEDLDSVGTLNASTCRA